jgi:transposase-like protein
VTKPRPAEFKWRQFEPQVILMAVGWYLRFSLSYRDVEELVRPSGLSATWMWLRAREGKFVPVLLVPKRSYR